MSAPPVLDRRVVDVLGHLGLSGLPVTAEAADLLLDRRRVRRRAGWWLAVSVALIVALGALGISREAAGSGGYLGYVVVMELATILAITTNHGAIRRSERELGLQLPRRTSRAEAVTVGTVLGRGVVLVSGAVVALHVVMVLTLFVRGDSPAAWAFVVVCITSYLLAIWAVLQVVGRAVLAVDPLTLAADDRWRSSDAHRACAPLVLAAFMFAVMVGPTNDHALALLGLAPLVLNLLFQLAGAPARWNRVGRR